MTLKRTKALRKDAVSALLVLFQQWKNILWFTTKWNGMKGTTTISHNANILLKHCYHHQFVEIGAVANSLQMFVAGRENESVKM